ncbi:transcriptional regulator [Rhodococcoides trifolii]|uniref:Transcriptional regulator n=1 Tax=Rhodococcoides trifolii TaxID=908250 RepID=A0A917CP34_9NOCA|nr:MarR family transcriptional regulator [Rhodococcus trifolii]GGF94457.1 transcriptional regulator [Rhodococcus trifolii]
MAEPIESAWRVLVSLVFENRDTWRRRVAEEVDMPFSRIRVLKRLRGGPLTVGDLATAAAMDAPAATVCVNHLEKLGYVVRTVDEGNRRRKQVTITDAGLAVLDRAARIDDPVPDALRRLDPADAAELHRILSQVADIEP